MQTAVTVRKQVWHVLEDITRALMWDSLKKCYIYEFNHLYIFSSIVIKIDCIRRLEVSGMIYLLVKDDVDS